MAGFVKELANADAFLGNLRTLPSFKRAQELQVKKIIDLVKRKKGVDEDMVTQSSEAFGRLVNFDEDQKQQFMDAMLDAFEETGKDKKRLELQDYTNMPYLIPKAVWQNIHSQTIVEKRVMVLCQWLEVLGLANPTESTIGAMTVVIHWPEWSVKAPAKSDMAQSHLFTKPLIRRATKTICMVSKTFRGPLYLPNSFQKLPMKLRQAFGKTTLGAIKFL